MPPTTLCQSKKRKPSDALAPSTPSTQVKSLKIPSDCLYALLSYLQVHKIAILRRTCREWNNFIVKDNQTMWRRLFLAHYGEKVLYLEPVTLSDSERAAKEEKRQAEQRYRRKKVLVPLPNIVNYVTKEKPHEEVDNWYEEYISVYKSIPHFTGSRDEKLCTIALDCLSDLSMRFVDPQISEDIDDLSWERLDRVEALPMRLWHLEPFLRFRTYMVASFLGALCENAYIPSRTELVKVGYEEQEQVLIPLSQFCYYVLMNYAQHLYPLKENDEYLKKKPQKDAFQVIAHCRVYQGEYLDAMGVTMERDLTRVSVCLNTEEVFVPFVFYLDREIYEAHGEVDLEYRPELKTLLTKMFPSGKTQFYEFVCSSQNGSWYQKFHNANFDWYEYASMIIAREEGKPGLVLLKTKQAAYRNF